MEKIRATAVKYIKLGEGGEWERECLTSGIIRFGYDKTPHQMCLEGKWEEVNKVWLEERKYNQSTATSDVRQIRTFYTATPDMLFITFSQGLLYWCQPSGEVTELDDGSRIRPTVNGWHNHSLAGNLLSHSVLSGALLATQSYRGTICDVRLADYALRKINDEQSPEIKDADIAETQYLKAITRLCSLLTWQDFELLVDLIFSASGWRRTGCLGRTQKTVDIELELPTTGERAFVQVKSVADPSVFSEYLSLFQTSDSYARMFFVWHRGTLSEDLRAEGVTMIGPIRLAELILDTGLARWLRNKVL
ncbi:hypothetical protein V6N79_005533 [Klebsiella pneumoniae]